MFILLGSHEILPSEAYAGSLRSLRYAAPVDLLGDRFHTSPELAAEVAELRRFIDVETDDDEPIFSQAIPPQGATAPAVVRPDEPAAPPEAPQPAGRGKRARRGPTDWSSVPTKRAEKRGTKPSLRVQPVGTSRSRS